MAGRDDLDKLERSADDRYAGKYSDPYGGQYGGQYGSDDPGHYKKAYGSDEPKGGKTSSPTGDLSSAPEPADLAQKETTADPDQVGRGYRPDNLGELTKIKPSAKGVMGFARANRGKIIIGGAAAGFITLLIVGFLVLIPFKILHIVNNLESRFFASSENAVQKQTDVLFSDYLKRYVMPGLTTCKGSTIDKKCTPGAITGKSIVSRLYGGWKTARLENTLAEKYGMEFKKVGSNFLLKMPGTTGDGVSLGDENTGFMKSNQTLDEFMANDSRFQKVGRSELRQSYRNALANETKWKQVMYRYKVGGLLARKYGLKRCIIACNTRDNFNDWKDFKTRAAKMIIAERVLAPRSETLAIVIQCVISGGCDPADKSGTASDGHKQSNVQTRLQGKLTELAAKDTGKYADVLANSSTILKDGYKKFIIQKIVKSIGGDGSKVVSEKIANDLVPVVGWVNTASGVVKNLEKVDKGIKAWSYMLNATAMVSLYTTYRVFADETKSGNVDPTILGSFISQLSSVSDKTAAGGTASAEQAPLYATLIGGANPQQSGSSSYKCNDGNPVPTGQQICQEEILGGNKSALADAANRILESLGPLKSLADFWDGPLTYPLRQAAKLISDAVVSKLRGVPGYDQLVAYLSKAAEPIIRYMTDWAFPSPFSDNMSGGRTFDMLAGGADVSGNDYAQNGLGGRALSAQQAVTILNEQTQQNIQDYKSQPFFARIFDTNNQYSLVSRVAVAMPGSWSSARQSIASIFSNPFGWLGKSFASLFTFNHAFAAAPAQADPFGVTQHGYLPNDPNLAVANAAPEKYWTENCSSTDGTTLDWSKGTNAAWQNSTTTDPNTGMPENDTTDPCLLLQATVGSDGGLNEPSLLTADDLADGVPTGSSGGTGGGSGSGFTNPFPGGWIPNRLDMGYDGTFSGQIVAPFDGTITYAGPLNGWNGSLGIIIKADNDVGLPTRSLFFTEGVGPIVSSGQHVTAGTPIANAVPSPYGDAYGHGANGAIEWGVSEDGPIGQQVDTEAIALGNCSAAAKQMVLNFAQWAEQSLGVTPPSATDHAGCA